MRVVLRVLEWHWAFVAAPVWVTFGCGPAPLARTDSAAPASARPGRPQRADPCLPKAGQTVEPLARRYDGLARAARCQPEVLTIMEDVAAALGVECSYCHPTDDYRAQTPRKQIANWMATELMPRLVAKDGGEAVWCSDCHSQGGKPVARILGAPRTESRAIHWMTTRLVEDFVQQDGKPLRCKSCHGGNLGSTAFRRRLVLTDALAGLPLLGDSVGSTGEGTAEPIPHQPGQTSGEPRPSPLP